MLMKLLPKILCIVCVLLSLQLFAQNNIKLTSPNGNIVFNFKLANNTAMYSVAFKGKTIVDYSALSLKFDNGNFENTLTINKPVFRDISEDYELVVGKTKNVHSHYREVVIPLEETVTPQRQINLVARAFDDGIGFRYEYPQQKNWVSYTLLDENTTFKLTGNPTVHALFLPNYTTSHEGVYSTLPLSDVKEDTLMDMPALFEFSDNIWLAITEAALLDYAGMYLIKHDGILTSKLSPLPGQTAIKVKAMLPHHSPWRVLMINDRVGALIESNILTSLNEPCKIKDVSWIKPGKTTFPWWNGNITPDTSFAPGNNFETNKYYIDFCARSGLEYHSVVEYGLHQWYVDDGVPFEPGPHADVTTPVPGLNMQQVCDYAKQQGVGIRVWVHWAALYPKLDTAFTLFQKWGIKGMMVDFMDRDDQEMVNIQTEILQKAATHHLHIQFHGAYKPTGLNRTYPNEFTREGTRNYEVNKWDENGIGPDHDINIPFTRMLAGSTDYHLGGFRAVPKSQFKVQYTRPLMLGTRCHMLAMYVVLENYLGMVCDYPAAYEGQPGFEFIKEIPTVWDETKVPYAKVGEFITIARRKKDDWFIGTITNETSRHLSIPLTFLSDGNYIAEIYTDVPEDENPNHLIKQTRILTRQDFIQVNLAAGGGEVMHLRKQ
jgi:alpha-glucosidase